MEYLLKASAVIAIFYICYNLFLQRETFFQSNRWFLLLGLITAFCIPFIVIPVYIEQTVAPIQDFILTENNMASIAKESISMLEIFSALYFIGVAFFFIRFITQLYSLSKVLVNNKKEKYNQFIFIETTCDLPPFSFFKWIVFNPSQFNETELKQILTHEKVHAYQLHSIDILISQLATIILWFNPLIWLYKKNLQQNLEFIADNTAHHKANCKKSYQHLLLKTSLPNHQLALTNNFYNSLIKKRIVMLHKNKSKNRNLWKFALILPVLALFLTSFNTKEIITYKDVYNPVEDLIDATNVLSESKTNADDENLNSAKAKVASSITESVASKTNANSLKSKITSKYSGDHEMVIITKDYTEIDLKKIKKQFAKEGLTLKFKGIKRNDKGEITAIKIDVSSKSSNANYNINSDDPISPIKISFDREGNNISIGNASDLHFGKGDNYSFVTKEGNHKVHTSKKGDNTFIFRSDDEHEHDGENENVFIIKKNGKVHELKNIHKDKNVHIIHDDKEIIELKGHGKDKHKIIINRDKDGKDKHKIIINRDKDGKVVKEWISDEDDDKEVWVTDDDNTFKVKTLGKSKNKFFISGDGENNPIFILDGKEVSKKVIDELDPDTIDKMEVLKGESATKEYGSKAEHGVIIITTKTKD